MRKKKNFKKTTTLDPASILIGGDHHFRRLYFHLTSHFLFFPEHKYRACYDIRFSFQNKKIIIVFLAQKWNSLERESRTFRIFFCCLVVSGNLSEQAHGRHSSVVPRDQLTLSAAEPDNKGQKFESKFWPIISRCLLV